jgi:hypothetical protein
LPHPLPLIKGARHDRDWQDNVLAALALLGAGLEGVGLEFA